MNVSVVYALPEKQCLYDVSVKEGACVNDAILLSGILTLFPALSLEHVGIYGKKVTLDTVLSDGDRVEIYRPLMVDPKEARKKRSAELTIRFP
ncbi:MAG: RnfH family protein [Gammaproteobacteria bacterium]